MKEELEDRAVTMLTEMLNGKLTKLKQALEVGAYESLMLVRLALRTYDPADDCTSSFCREYIRDNALRILVTEVVAPQLPINLLKALHKASPGAYQDFKLALYCDSLDPYFCPPQPPL